MIPILAERFIRPFFPELSDRMIDRILVGRDTPQEAQGLLSRYFDRKFIPYNRMSAEDLARYIRKLQYLEKKTRFLWKAPYMTHHVTEIASLFPDSQFIYIHRDPVVCVASKLKFIKIWQRIARPPSILYRHLVGKHQNFSLLQMGYFMEQANRTVNLFHADLDSRAMAEDHLLWMEKALRDLTNLHDPRRCCFLDYETLSDQPKDSLPKLFDFLGLLDESDDVLDKMKEIGMPLRKPMPAYEYVPEEELREIARMCRGRIQKIRNLINRNDWYLIKAPSLDSSSIDAGEYITGRSKSLRR
jgi:hypothetical protein